MSDKIEIMLPPDLTTSTVTIENIKNLSVEYIHLQHLEFEDQQAETQFDQFQLMTIHQMIRRYIDRDGLPVDTPQGYTSYFTNLRNLLNENNSFRHYAVERSKIKYHPITRVMTFPLRSKLH